MLRAYAQPARVVVQSLCHLSRGARPRPLAHTPCSHHVRLQVNMTTVAEAPVLTVFKGTSCHDLRHWLTNHGVDLSSYGSGLSKTVDDLLEEQSKQESVLAIEAGRALRIVNVLSLHITNSHGLVLYEESQILPDGRIRKRNIPISEKLIGDEAWQHAVQRAVQEELGSTLPDGYQVTVFENTYRLATEFSTSLSYPGLTTKYNFHRVNAHVTGLPEKPFDTYEARPGGQLVTKWVWLDPARVTGKCKAT